MAFDMGAWRKAQMEAQDAKLQTSTHAPTQQVPGGGHVSEVSAANAMQKSDTPAPQTHNRRRRNRHRIAQAMAVYAMTSAR